MGMETVALRLPATLYAKAEELAVEAETNPADLVATLIETAHQRRTWLREFKELREQIKREGGLSIGSSREEVVEQLRQTRREIFDAEYAHLYR